MFLALEPSPKSPRESFYIVVCPINTITFIKVKYIQYVLFHRNYLILNVLEFVSCFSTMPELVYIQMF